MKIPRSTGASQPNATRSKEGAREVAAKGGSASTARGAAAAVGDADRPALTEADLPKASLSPTSGATLRGHGFFPVSAHEVKRVRAGKEPARMAKVLHDIVNDRSNLLIPNDAVRLERMRDLLAGLGTDDIDEVRAAYVERYGCDPEVNLRCWDFFEPLARLNDNLAVEMVALLEGPHMGETAATLAALVDKARRDELTTDDRTMYFSLLPMVGIWSPPVREDAAGLDAMERAILKRAVLEHEPTLGLSLDDALETIEAKLPGPDLAPKARREKSVAVVVSSAGAQWQELMDWLLVLDKVGVHVQVFTPDGRPAAFQRDSQKVNERTSKVGFGCPPHLDPSGPAGAVARRVLGATASAESFDPEHFGAVFCAGGLGFNEDVTFAEPVRGDDGRASARLKNHPNIDAMMRRAVDARLPNVAVCHGPTIYAATTMRVDGREEPVSRGIETASLPPFESYVGLTGRKERQFTYDVNTHQALEEAGGYTEVAKDIADMSRVVVARKDGMEVITGPGPQAAKNLGFATLAALERRWG